MGPNDESIPANTGIRLSVKRCASAMNSHHNKQRSAAPSQIFPSAQPKMVPDVTLADTYVGLCDWHGRVVWKSGNDTRLQIGDELWENAASRSRESLRTAVASVVTLRENRTIEVENRWNEHYRVWM